MTLGSILSDRKTELISRIKEEYGTSVFHTRGFVNRVLGYEEVKQFINADCFDLSGVSEAVKYEGFPYLAYLGFAIGMGLRSSQEQTVIDAFVLGLNRLQERSRSSLDEFLEDDVALFPPDVYMKTMKYIYIYIYIIFCLCINMEKTFIMNGCSPISILRKSPAIFGLWRLL